MGSNPMVNQLAQMIGTSSEAIIDAYWWGVLIVAVLTTVYLLFKHYREYYRKLKAFIERDGNGGVPSAEIDVAELLGSLLLIGAVGFCWPAGVIGGVVAVVVVTSVKTVKFLVNLPHQVVQRILVRQNKGRMLTSPSPYIRWLAESHSKKKMDREQDDE